MKRLLCILSGMNAGGAETFLMKIYRNIDRTRYQMDFCINVVEKCFYEDEINSLGGKIYRIPSKSDNLKEFKRQLAAVVRDNHYEYVLRITSSAMGFMDLEIAKKAGARVCCARSSNASDGGSLKSKIAHTLGRILYQKYIDVAVAPSDLAAIYTFGKAAYESGSVSILHNAVDLGVFHFDSEERTKIRSEFNFDDDVIVLGHVGRFAEQKNHMFLADIFKSVHDKNPNTRLLLIGNGPLRAQFEEKIKALNLQNAGVCAGIRTDVPKVLSAMDAFVFPSLYEGMPNTVIEAQATGLPCVIADTITREADITGLVSYLPLQDPGKWAEAVLLSCDKTRQDTKEAFIRNKYDIQSAVDEFVRIIFSK